MLVPGDIPAAQPFLADPSRLSESAGRLVREDRTALRGDSGCIGHRHLVVHTRHRCGATSFGTLALGSRDGAAGRTESPELQPLLEREDLLGIGLVAQ